MPIQGSHNFSYSSFLYYISYYKWDSFSIQFIQKLYQRVGVHWKKCKVKHKSCCGKYELWSPVQTLWEGTYPTLINYGSLWSLSGFLSMQLLWRFMTQIGKNTFWYQKLLGFVTFFWLHYMYTAILSLGVLVSLIPFNEVNDSSNIIWSNLLPQISIGAFSSEHFQNWMCASLS